MILLLSPRKQSIIVLKGRIEISIWYKFQLVHMYVRIPIIELNQINQIMSRYVWVCVSNPLSKLYNCSL